MNFSSEAEAYKLLEKRRWNGKIVCPHCGSTNKPYRVNGRSAVQTEAPNYRCSNRACQLPFNAKTGTIYQGSKMELHRLFQAVCEIDRNRTISSTELATRLGTTQKTAWILRDKILPRLDTDLLIIQPKDLLGLGAVKDSGVYVFKD